MEVNEKRARIEGLFNQQKEILKTLSVANLFDVVSEVRKLELQKEIIKAIPRKKSH